MTETGSSIVRTTHVGAGRIGQIPVRNLWLLMLYASDLFRSLHTDKVAIEDNPDNIPDLVAEILCRNVERRLQRNLSFGYRHRQSVLSRVRGRIDLLHTERHRLLERGMVACRYDELTVDTARNCFVRSALDELSRIVNRQVLSHRCKSLSNCFKSMGVIGECPRHSEVTVDRFGRHDIDDRPMVAAAHLAFNLAIPTELSGKRHLLLPDRDITWVRKLYEKGVAGFYATVLPKQEWIVDAGKFINWKIQSQSKGISKILPSMRTDITLTHVASTRRIIMDTKFNSIVTAGWYREETLRSGYIYQIYAYLRSQESEDDRLANCAEGMLLHPCVGEMVNETVEIQGHKIRFATVDLGADAGEIRAQLLNAIQPQEL